MTLSILMVPVDGRTRFGMAIKRATGHSMEVVMKFRNHVKSPTWEYRSTISNNIER